MCHNYLEMVYVYWQLVTCGENLIGGELLDKYQSLLRSLYPSKSAIATEIINLSAILNLPKATEHFISDIHGEYEAFQHVLRNGSGNVRKKIDFLFADRYGEEALRALATLVYYPEEITEKVREELSETDYHAWYEQNLTDLIELCVFASKRYTRSKVRKALPTDSAYILEELLYQAREYSDKDNYYKEIFKTIFELDQEQQLIISLGYLIQRFVVDHLHVVGDIYDRGPYPDKIMDTLLDYHSVDIQWGNHDILWMAAACGVKVSLANVIRICARYNNLDILEDHYGINLLPLLNLATSHYQVSDVFLPKETKKQTGLEVAQVAKIHQAITIIQFKLEGQILQRQPEFLMADRDLLSKIDYQQQTIKLNEATYSLLDGQFPTINPTDPLRFTEEEEQVLTHLVKAFQTSEKLQRHVAFLFEKGQMYQVYNDSLLIHGCIPLDDAQTFKNFSYQGTTYKGRELLDFFDHYLRKLYTGKAQDEGDLAWYLWTGECSPLFGKQQMTTFERYFIADKKTHKEVKNCYYSLRDNEAVCRMILHEFDLDEEKGHIINGHTPIKEKDGEDPIKGNGKMIVIDGGFSKAYQKKTGIAGYTLLNNSYGMELVAHQPFTSKKDAIKNGTDIISTKRVVDRQLKRKTVGETTVGTQLLEQLTDLKALYQQV